MVEIINLKVECLKHSIKETNNKGKEDFKPFLIDRAFARDFLLKENDPVCFKCGFKCKGK